MNQRKTQLNSKQKNRPPKTPRIFLERYTIIPRLVSCSCSQPAPVNFLEPAAPRAQGDPGQRLNNEGYICSGCRAWPDAGWPVKRHISTPPPSRSGTLSLWIRESSGCVSTPVFLRVHTYQIIGAKLVFRWHQLSPDPTYERG